MEKHSAVSALNKSECAQMIACGVNDDDPEQIEHHDKDCPAYESLSPSPTKGAEDDQKEES